jgi:hypothetical protein
VSANAASTSFEDMLADPYGQYDLRGELLPHLLAFSPTDQHLHLYPADTSGVARCRCGYVVPPAAVAVPPVLRAVGG